MTVGELKENLSVFDDSMVVEVNEMSFNDGYGCHWNEIKGVREEDGKVMIEGE